MSFRSKQSQLVWPPEREATKLVKTSSRYGGIRDDSFANYNINNMLL